MSRPAVPSPGRDPERTLPFSAPVVPPAAHLPPEYAGETAPGAPGAAPRVTVVEPPKESFDKEPGVHPEPSSGTTTPETQNYADMQDYFDWTTETDVTESARDDSADAVRKLSLRNMSPAKLVLILCTTFLGNLVLTGIMLVPILVIHYVYRKRDDDHKVYIADNVEAWFIWAAFNLHLQWWIHFLVELMPAIITGVLRLVWGAPGQRLQNYLEYYRALNRYLKLLFYAALNWGSWTIIFNSIFGLYSASNPSETSRAPYTYRIYQVMEFIVIVKFIAIRFHKSSYADRIQNMTHAVKVLDHLYNHRPKAGASSGAPNVRAFAQAGKTFLRERTRPDEPAEGTQAPASRSSRAKQRVLDFHAALVDRAHKSSAKASRLAAIGMRDPAQLLKTIDMGIKLDINSPAQAKKVARSLYKAYQRDPSRRFLLLSDFAPAYPNDPAAAERAFAVFDRDGNGDISQLEIKNTVLELFKERRILAQAMQDLNHAVGQLDLILVIIACIFVLFEALAIFKVNANKTLSSFYTMGIAFAFVFKESAQNLFDSIIFLFVTHPFDSGDLIQLGDSVYVVKKLSLLSTELVTTEALDLYMSNTVLAASNIINYRRSKHQYEETKIQVAFDTPWEKLDAVQNDLNHWIENDIEHRFVYPSIIRPQKYYYMRVMECTVGMTHAHNWQDWGNRLHRKVAFMAALLYYLRKHGIVFEEGLQSAHTWDQDWQAEYEQKREAAQASVAAGDTSAAAAEAAQLPEEPLPAKMATNEAHAARWADAGVRHIDWEKTWNVTEPDLSFDTQPAGTLATDAPQDAATTYMYFRPPPQEMAQLRMRRRKVTGAVGGGGG
ncbi:hypothetical protein CBS9595_003176 [Malassezia furfur]|nr:hypothetical protein CBS9595_003176 [Malassezia furfur]